MGRRKIEIKPIKDDRNRSVTFLKRKGGLFKKAYELSVLCSVDVAVVIFGQNRKLYEFSSGDIHETLGRHQYYTSAHEHKGPADFQDKDGGGDDDDDDDGPGSGQEESMGPQNGVNYPPHQPAIHHMRHGSHPMNTPPMQNGMFQNQRMSSVEPQRPDSRNQHQRVGPNFTPQNHPQLRAQQQAYHPNAAYLQARQQNMHMPNQGPPPPQPPQMHPGQQMGPMQRQQAYTLPIAAPPQAQMQQMYLEDQRRQSMPPYDRAQSVPAFRQSPPQMTRPFGSPPMPGSPKFVGQNMHRPQGNVYAPINNEQQMMNQQQHWVSAPAPEIAIAASSAPPNNGLQQAAPGHMEQRPQEPIQQNTFARPESNQRPRNTPQPQQEPTFTQQPTRVNSIDAKRPRLAIQIPGASSSDEASASAALTNNSPEQARGPNQGSANATPPRPGIQPANSDPSHARSGSIVLPPPSPSQPTSANPTLSAGATGPSNPFARPPPPSLLSASNTNRDGNSDNNGNSNNNITTPVSALPSRIMSNDGLLPSPSSFYPEWNLSLMSAGGMSAGMGNSLQSPGGLLMWQPTPIREESGHRWPKIENTATGNNASGSDDERKRKPDVITPIEPGDVKRSK